jgi:hypothetical protein
MSIDKMRSKIIASIWQAIAQSELDLSTISQEDLESLVMKIADSTLLAYDSIMEDEFQKDQVDISELEDEVQIWKGRPFLSLVESYVVTSERVKIITGFVSRRVENFELIRIQDIDYRQNVSERIFGIGDISIRGHDQSDPAILLRNVIKPEEVYELLRKAWLEARKRYGLQFREYM